MKLIAAFITIASCAISNGFAAAELSDIERKQRKVVVRMFELTEAAPVKCPSELKEGYLKSVSEFQRLHPDFHTLLQTSRFRAYAVQHYTPSESDLAVPESEAHAECTYLKDLLDSNFITERPSKAADSMIEILQTTN